MYTTVQLVHSWWAYLVLFVVVIATINALAGTFTKKEFGHKDFRLALFALIVTHLQLVIGLILFFISPNGLKAISNNGMPAVMENETLRLYAIEHPTIMVFTVLLITFGYSRHKKKRMSQAKFKILAIFYTLGLILLLSRIPWQQWFS